MVRKKEKDYSSDLREEYGLEFGDINAAKFYEMPLTNECKNTKERKKK